MHILRTLGKAALGLNVELRKFVFGLYKPEKVINVNLDQTTRISLRCSGNIAEILFAEQRLVPYSRSFESLTLKLFRELLQPDSTVIDVGANVGMYSIFFARIAERSRIFSFEPNEATRTVLQDNIILNGIDDRVEVLSYALSDSDSDAFLVCPEGRDAFAFLTDNDEEDSIPVKMMKLDTFVSNRNIDRVNLIKVDIEGAELLFLKGAECTLRDQRPVIVFELAHRWTSRFGYIPSDVIRWLGDRDYVCFGYEHEQWIAIPEEQLETRKAIEAFLIAQA